jgi:hypothetical protein
VSASGISSLVHAIRWNYHLSRRPYHSTKEMSLSQPEIPSTLLLLSVDDEKSAREAFDQMIHLHSVALLTLQGLVLISASPAGVIDVISSPSNLVGLEKIEEAPTFRPLLDALESLTADGTNSSAVTLIAPESAGNLLSGDVRRQITGYLSPGHWTVVALATNIAEGEVTRQLDLLTTNRYSVQLTRQDEEELRSAG